MKSKIWRFLAILIMVVGVCATAITKTDIQASESFREPQIIRCTGYCEYGYTKSGQYTREGIVAGKKEWLGKLALIWAVDEDGSIGEFLGFYEFLDTGYGINGSLKNGTSIDVWFPTEDAVWEWMNEYGDYVYLQIIDAKG